MKTEIYRQLAAEAAKNIKSEQDLHEFKKMLTKMTLETAHNDERYLLGVNVPAQITQPAVATTPVTNGAALGVAWSDIASPTPLDWVGVFEVGAPATSYLDGLTPMVLLAVLR